MRRALVVTVTAVVSMVMLALLVPMGVLIREYALEDRLARAALEVQATETVVSAQDRGTVSVYVEQINSGDGGTLTTVLYPDGQGVGPVPGEDDAVREARETGRARVDDTPDGARILVPVSLGFNSVGPEQTPVIRVDVAEPGLGAGVLPSYLALAALALVLLGAAVLLADRLGRSFVRPLDDLASYAAELGTERNPAAPEVEGPAEVRALAAALNRMVERVEVLLVREREGVADLAHRLRTPMTALRLRIERVPDSEDRQRLSADLDELEQTVDTLVREARRSEREGMVAGAAAVGVLAERTRFWEPLADDQGRPFTLTLPVTDSAVAVRASADDLVALLDVLMDNVFSHTPEGAAVEVRLAHAPADQGGGVLLVVEDAGPGFPVGVDVVRRGESAAGSTGLGLAIVARTAEASGGSLSVGRSSLGGARVQVRLGPAT